MKKGTFRLLIAVAAVLAFAGTALGAGQVTLKTTVPNIPKSICYQAGTITMEIDPGTQIRIGDVIQFTTQNNTSICKNIDFFLSLNAAGAAFGAPPTAPTAWGAGDADGISLTDDTNLPVAGSAGRLVIDQSLLNYVPTPGIATGVAEAQVYGFLVKGSVGSQIITMTFGYLDGNFEFQTLNAVGPESVLRYTGAGAALDPSDRFIIRLFDQKKNSGYFWKPDSTPANGTAAPDYTLTGDPATPPNEDGAVEFVGADNALCIDTLTQDYQLEFVEATPDSRPISANALAVPPYDDGYNLNFSGDYRIAKILPSLTYELVACKSAATGIIALPTGGQGSVANCSFDLETDAGFCLPATTNNNLVIGSVGGTFPRGEEFILTLEVLVNGQTGDRGVYFSGDNIVTQGYVLLDDACDVETNANATAVGGTYYRQDNAFTATPTTDTDCTVASSNRYIRYVSQVNDLDLNETAQDDRYLAIDLPSFIYDTSVVQTNDDVSVRVTLTQDPCGIIFQDDMDLGTFGSCAGGGLATQSLLYPYFTAADGTFFDSAFVIANIGTTAGGVTLYWYEADGDAFTGAVAGTVAANTIWNSGLMPQLVEDPNVTWTQTAGSGDQGDAMCYIVACTEFPSDGFAFIFGAPQGDSMGYIPRATATTAYAGAAECQ